jgi:hypothetical protein
MSFLSQVRRFYVLAGDVIPVNFGKNAPTPPKPKKIKPGTPAHHAQQHIERAEKHGIPMNMLVDRFASKDDQFYHKFNAAMDMEHDEPYYGGDPMTHFHGEKEKQLQKVVPFPLPVVVKDLKGILGKGVPQATGADPFMWMDSKYGATKAALKSHHDKPLEIHTRSDLVSHDDYVALLNPNKHKVFIHLFTESPEISRALEPGIPSPLRRLKAAERLKENNIPVTIVLDALDADPFVRKGLHNELSAETKNEFKTAENVLKLSAVEQKHLRGLVSEHQTIEKPKNKKGELIQLHKTHAETGSHKWYHGTTSTRLAKIKEQGLVPVETEFSDGGKETFFTSSFDGGSKNGTWFQTSC